MCDYISIPSLHVLPRKELDTNKYLSVLRDINTVLKIEGKLTLEILQGDYEGSIATFTPLEGHLKDDVVIRNYSGDYNISCHWAGRLSWKGKKNNPHFIITPNSCRILPVYKGETILKRFDLKAENKKLLDSTVEDVNDCTLFKGDTVIYMNIRYGCGGKLCYGTITDFKAHARQGYVSVIVSNNDNPEETSELNYPHMQIIKVTKQEKSYDHN